MKYKIISILIASLLIGMTFAGMIGIIGNAVGEANQPDSPFAGGSGTVADPYIIEDVWELQNMSLPLNAHYALGNDIDAGITSGWNSGEGFVPIGTDANRFTGSLDGRNYTITGLYINRPTSDYIGLFGYMDSGAIVANISFLEYDVSGRYYVGGLAGYNNGGTVINAYTYGIIICNEHSGGLVGYNAGTIINVHAAGNLSGYRNLGGLVGRNYGTINNAYITSSVVGSFIMGGLVGINYGTISSSYATGSVSGATTLGGLLGYNFGTVVKCYSTGSVSGTGSLGGLLGYNAIAAGPVTSCFYDAQTSGQTDTGKGAPKTTAEMMSRATFTGWDFASTWWMIENVTYPLLQLQPVYNVDTGEYFDTIQSAIDDTDTMDGHTIAVMAGTYYENVVVDKQLSLIGAGQDVCIIDGGGVGDVVYVTADWVNITGFSVTGSGNNYGDAGIQLNGVQNCIIENNNCSLNYFGIGLESSSSNTIANNTCSSNSLYGLDLDSSNNNTINNNTANSNDDIGIHLHSSSNSNTVSNNTCSLNWGYGGICVTWSSSSNTVSNNTCNSNSLYGIWLYVSCSSNTISNNTCNLNSETGIALSSWCISNTISDNTCNLNSLYGIHIYNSNDNTINNNTCSLNGWDGIVLQESSNGNTVSNNTCNSNVRYGIWLYVSCNSNTVSNNTCNLNSDAGIALSSWCISNIISDNTCNLNILYGIDIYNSNDNTINNNTCSSNNQQGLYLRASSNSNTIANNVASNNGYGIYLVSSNSNFIFHNNIIANTVQAYDDGVNQWHNGYPTGGNYWDDYSGFDMFSGPNQDQLGADGIGDTPKSFTGGQDNYPLTTPFGSPSTGAVMINSHSNGQLVSGTILVEAAVTGIGINGVNFYVDGVLMGYDGTNNYQFILNTNTLAEDVPFAITAEAILLYSPNINTTVTLIPNNLLNAGNYISVSTPEPEYSPDEDVAVLIDIINAPPTFDNLGIVLSYDEPTGYTQYTSTYNLPVDDMYQITMSLPSDAALGTYDVTAMAYGYVGEVLVWTANDTTQFDVVGQSVQDQLGDLNQTVGDMNNTLIDMNNTFNDFNSTFNDINSTFQNMNQTFEDIWNSFVNMEGNISSILENITRMRADLVLMNNTLFDIVNDIAGMNSSLSGLVNDLSSQLNAVNTSLHTSLTNLENNFLVELAGVNATLALDIQNLLASVTDDLAGMNITLGGRLTMLEGNLSGNISDLSNWLDLMLHEMDANLTATNMTLHQHMADLEAMTTEFYNNLTADLLDVMGRFFAMETNLTLQHNALINSIALLSDAVDAQHNLTRTQILDRVNQTYALLDSVDGNLTTHDSDIQALLAALDALVQNQGNMTRDQLVANTTQILADVATVQSNITSHDTAIRQNMTTLSNLMVTLDQQSLAIVNYIVSELAQNLSAHDTGISDDLLGITDDISGFRDLTDEQLQVINTTLENLVKLDGIITDLEELDLALQAAETQLSDDIGTTSNSEISKIDLGTMLLAVLIILAIISILIGLMNRRTNVSTPAAGNDEADFEKDGSEGVEESEENPEIEESI